MKKTISNSLLTLIIIGLLTSCASGYKMIEPKKLTYTSKSVNDSLVFQYRYNLLDKRYAKKEIKKEVRLVAVKLTNNTQRDLIFGEDIQLVYQDGRGVPILDNNMVFTQLKQKTPIYLLYLLLSPLQLSIIETNSSGYPEESTNIPIGLVLGPGITIGNMVAAGSANKNFKTELLNHDIIGKTIKKGETSYGLIGVRSDSGDIITVKVQ